jgi:hypothetical protein
MLQIYSEVAEIVLVMGAIDFPGDATSDLCRGRVDRTVFLALVYQCSRLSES